jgi:DNA-binding response OmpR family regulator
MTEALTISVHPDRSGVVYGDRRLPATPRVTKMVGLLIANAGKTVPISTIARAFGWNADRMRGNAKVAISHARRVFREGGVPAVIEPVRHEGYRLQVRG